MRFIIFATIFFSVMALLTFYISRRFVRKLHIPNKLKKAINIFLAINLLGVLAYMFARYEVDVPNWLYFLLSLPIGVIFLFFATTVIYEIISHLPKIHKDEKRRDFFKKSIDIASLTFATAITAKAIDNARHIEIEKIDVKINGLKKSFKMIQLSDVHIGGLIDRDFIKNMVETVNELKPDLVVITGDLVDTKLQYAKPAFNELANLQSQYGTFFIVGNHEYFHGVNEIMDYARTLGIKVLENENVFIGQDNIGFNLAGVYDVMGNRIGALKPDIKKALENKKDAPTVLLAHQPRFLNDLETTKGIDLVLCGHTHGGQIIPFNFLVKLQQPYVRNLNQHNEFTQVYVNKGTGFWGPPMRLGASSEITVLTLS